jgi:hypothetical protein
MKRPVLIFILLISCLGAKAQLIISAASNYNPTVQSLLGGCCAQTSNAHYTGAPLAGGEYNATQTPLGLTHGIILTSGSRNIALGPNNINSAGIDNGLPGDNLLTQACGFQTFDATTLEFDFVSPVNAITGFRYVFASEEYPEFVGSVYNDIFVCLLSGPDINGELNIATVPDSTLPVTINNYNITTYEHYFVANDSGAFTQYDGYTFPLNAKFIAKANMVYHIRMIIADASDGIYDSGVMIEAAYNPTGIEETLLTGDNKFTVYPNPSGNSLAIKSNSLVAEKVTIDLFDLTGKQIQSVYNGTLSFTQSTSMADISNLATGMYIVRIQQGAKTYNLKFIKS